MGNDGGSIPTRRELVKSASRAPTTSELKATALESLSHAWTHCPLSTDALDLSTCVSDWRGRLYNYESVLQALAQPADPMAPPEDDATAPDLVSVAEAKQITFATTAITSLRDVVKLKFSARGDSATTANGNGNGISKSQTSNSNTTDATTSKSPSYVCPISMKELGPQTKCVYLVPCGHVFADSAISEVLSATTTEAEAEEDSSRCPECSTSFTSATNIIPILPTSDVELQKLSDRMDALRAEGLAHSLKKDKTLKSKKKNKRKHEDGEKVDDSGGVKTEKQKKNNGGDRFSGINNSATASLTAKVVAELESKGKRRKVIGVH